MARNSSSRVSDTASNGSGPGKTIRCAIYTRKSTEEGLQQEFNSLETDFRDPIVKEHKQAEFLVVESFPWNLVERIGVIDNQIAAKVTGFLSNATHQPPFVAARTWYY